MSDSNDHSTGINYELLVDDSMRNVLRGALSIAEHVGLPGDSHFFITFRTDFDGVCINQSLLKDGENTLTIVIQHQYWDLKVEDEAFTVTLSFAGKPETLVVPFTSVTQFSDPSVGFALQFGYIDEAHDELLSEEPAKIEAITSDKDTASDESAEIVSLDSFRNRPKTD